MGRSTHQSQSLLTLCPEPLRAEWPHGRFRMPREVEAVTSAPFHSSVGSWHSLPVPGTHLLVLLQGHTGLCPILGLNEEQLVPLDVLKDALGVTGRSGHRAKHPVSAHCCGFPWRSLSGAPDVQPLWQPKVGADNQPRRRTQGPEQLLEEAGPTRVILKVNICHCNAKGLRQKSGCPGQITGSRAPVKLPMQLSERALYEKYTSTLPHQVQKMSLRYLQA